jgi:UDP-N-acetylmuramate dehydrogenase
MKTNEIYFDLIEYLPKGKIKIDEPLKNYTHTKIGGNADILVFPTEYKEIQDVVTYSNENGIPLTILGNATNVIVKDVGIRGIVMNLTKLNGVSSFKDKIVSQSGSSIIEISKMALGLELSGLEFACGIPGSVGGAVFMNAGAYGGEISDVLLSVLVLTKEGKLKTLTKDDLHMSYRHSIIPEKGYIVLEATFKLVQKEYFSIKGSMDEFTLLRETNQPLEYPSCGSVFKRPVGFYAGKLIQDSGLQGKGIGDAQVSTKHAGFIVNVGSATSDDYISLIKLIQNTVKQNYNVNLETEVRFIGGN